MRATSRILIDASQASSSPGALVLLDRTEHSQASDAERGDDVSRVENRDSGGTDESNLGRDPTTKSFKKPGRFKLRMPSSRTAVCALLAVFFVVLNWPFQYQPTRGIVSSQEPAYDLPVEIGDHVLAYPLQAGWPQRYLIRHSFDDAPTHTRWSVRALLVDVLIAVGLFAAAFWHLTPKRAGVSDPPAKRNLSLADLLVLVTMIGAGFGYYELQTRRQAEDEAIAEQLRSGGDVVRQTILPVAFKDYLPVALQRQWVRITGVTLDNPTEEQVEMACRLPYLRSLRIGGSGYDPENLRRLPSMRYLQDLRISGCELDSPTVLAISACPLVRQLNLAHTNSNESTVAQLAKMPRLRRLVVFGSTIPDAVWNDCGLKPQLRQLVLSRPETGHSGSVAISGWPELEKLSFRSLDGMANPKAYSIDVSDMPKLTELSVDAFQLIDLKLKSLPQLASLQQEKYHRLSRRAKGEKLPSLLWLRNVVLEDLPISNFAFYLGGFESIRVRDCDQLAQIVVSTHELSEIGKGVPNPGLDPDRQQELLDDLAEVKGNLRVSLAGMRLTDLDWTQFAANTSVSQLDLTDSVVGSSFMRQARTLPLKHLQAGSATMPGSFINDLKGAFPDLEFLRINSGINAVRIEDKAHLKLLEFDQHRKSNLTALRLVNVPELTSPMVVNPMGNYVFVDNAPSLGGLAILSSEAQVKLAGITGMRWFVGGGKSMTGENVREVLRSTGLRNLTIAYPDPEVGAECLAGLADLNSLSALRIPGSRLDDDWVTAWTLPDTLDRIDVRSCGLSSESTTHLIRHGQWRELMLSGNEIDPASLHSLGDRCRLTRLGLGGMSLDLKTIHAMGSMDELFGLDLSGATIAAGGLAALIKLAPNLRELNLRGATVDWSDVGQVFNSNSNLRMNIDPAAAPVQLMSMVLNSDRLLRQPDAMEKWFQPQSRRLMGYLPTGQPVYADEDEGPDQFELPDWSPDYFQVAATSNLLFPMMFSSGPNRLNGVNVSSDQAEDSDE
ncbi:hypothetical protein FYK55_20405 [Roseiconus nitratireducens]|uniref:Leucine Rich repeats (2 copies) n=1 Tax=Roseiconus nitratireducens TaxID=2605748 RepID=A0A5M6CZT9_9BACT|nr:hypothetical protein [Roseiconus nitratireducens]KAA5540747.1 hypothetical protein FYK55_20405 [Roseiconus nitratireducens]